MNIFEYIDQYGIYTFDKEPFNEIDATIFSFLSYVDYGNIVNEKITIKQAGRMHFGLHNKKERNVTAVRDATKLFNYIKDTKRYEKCILSRYIYDIENDIQFSVISIEYQKNKVYISFEGTDERISGWKENFVLAYEFPTLSHKKAINYINRYYTFTNKKIIIGGHSKGGNLALVAAMYANPIAKMHIEKIYNMDGPGLLEKQFNSTKYNKILPKYTHILPDNSIVGIILNSSNKKVIKTSISGPLSHDVLYWKIKDNKLEKGEQSSFSKQLEESIQNYVKNHEKGEIKASIDSLYIISKKVGIDTLFELKETKKVMKFLNECKSLDNSSRTMVYDLINIIIKSFGYSKYIDFLSFIKNPFSKR